MSTQNYVLITANSEGIRKGERVNAPEFLKWRTYITRHLVIKA